MFISKVWNECLCKHFLTWEQIRTMEWFSCLDDLKIDNMDSFLKLTFFRKLKMFKFYDCNIQIRYTTYNLKCQKCEWESSKYVILRLIFFSSHKYPAWIIQSLGRISHFHTFFLYQNVIILEIYKCWITKILNLLSSKKVYFNYFYYEIVVML